MYQQRSFHSLDMPRHQSSAALTTRLVNRLKFENVTKRALEERRNDTTPERCLELTRNPTLANFCRLKKIVRNGDKQWLKDFLDLDGLNQLLNAVEVLGAQRVRQLTDAMVMLECIGCIRAVLNARDGLTYLVERKEKNIAGKLVMALDTTNTLVKKQIFELLSALCVYSDEGYKLALGALENYKVSKTLRYRFSVIMAELKHAEVLAYKTTILAFINCILVATKDSHQRMRLRNEFVALNLLDIINDLRNEEDEDMEVQCDVFCDEKEDDEATMGQQEQTLDINDASALIDKINEEVRGQPEEVELLSILQSLYQASQQSVDRTMIFKRMSDAVHKLVTSPGTEPNLQNRQLSNPETRTDNSTQTGGMKIGSPDYQCRCEGTSTRVTTRGSMTAVPTPPITPERMNQDPASQVKLADELDTLSSAKDASVVNHTEELSCEYPEETEIKKEVLGRLEACPPMNGVPQPPPPPPRPDSHLLPDQACPGGPPLPPPPPPFAGGAPPSRPPPPFPGGAPPPPPPPFPGGAQPPPPPPFAGGAPPFPGGAVPPPPFPCGAPPPPPPPFPGGAAPPRPPGAPPFPGSPAMFAPQQPQIQTITTPKPKSKMKVINWSKVNPRMVVNQGEITFWEEVYGTPDPVEVDYNTIEKLFCQKLITNTGTSAKSEKKGPTEVNLLEAKRSMNVNIFLKQFKHSNDEIVRMIREGDLAQIGPERLLQLNKVMPEADEAEMIKNYADDKSKLGAAEKFYCTVIALPAYQLRLSAMMLKMDLQQGLESLNPDLEAILTAARSLLHSKSLIEFLRFVLHAGNFINAGSYAGNCVGFKVNSVLKLYEHRANKPRMTLLHFLVEEAENHKRDILSFAENLNAPLTKAAKISIDQMKADFNDLKTRCEKFSSKLDDAPDDLIQQCQQFVKRSQSALDDLREKFEEIERLRVTLAHNFCEIESSFRLEDILKIFSSFSEKVLLCRKENIQRLQQEERAEKRRQEAEVAKVQQQKQEATPGNEDGCIVDMLLSSIKKGNRVRKRALFAAAGDILTQGM